MLLEHHLLDIYILNNKYINIGSNTFEVVDQEAFKKILDEIETVSKRDRYGNN